MTRLIDGQKLVILAFVYSHIHFVVDRLVVILTICRYLIAILEYCYTVMKHLSIIFKESEALE
jgi:hypothetical protein